MRVALYKSICQMHECKCRLLKLLLLNTFQNGTSGVHPSGGVYVIMDAKTHVIKAFSLPIIYALQQMACQYQYINLKAAARSGQPCVRVLGSLHENKGKERRDTPEITVREKSTIHSLIKLNNSKASPIKLPSFTSKICNEKNIRL